MHTAFGTTLLNLPVDPHGKLDSVKYFIETNRGVDAHTPSCYILLGSIPKPVVDSKRKRLRTRISWVRTNRSLPFGERSLCTRQTPNKNGFLYFDGLAPLYGAVSDHYSCIIIKLIINNYK